MTPSSAARCERKPDAAPGKCNGWRPRQLQAGEGRSRWSCRSCKVAESYTSKLLPRGERLLPLSAQGYGRRRFVRGLPVCDVPSLCEEAGGLGGVSKSTASRIGQELGDRFRAVRALARDLTARGLRTPLLIVADVSRAYRGD